MELRHLRYFVAVAEELNFRRAAERLHVAHPSLSKQIRDLEDEVEARLLERNTARVRLTAAGAAFLERAREVLDLAEAAGRAAREAAAGRRPRLTVANAGGFTAGFMPASLMAFRRSHPDADVTLQEMELGEQIGALEAGLIQVGFTLMPPAEIPSHLEHRVVVRVPVCAVMARAHPLAGRTAVRPEELAAETIICQGSKDCDDAHAQKVIEAFRLRGIPLGPVKRVNSFNALFALVAGMHGITFLPQLQGLLPSEGVVAMPLVARGPDQRMELRAVWRKQDSSALVRDFVKGVRLQ